MCDHTIITSMCDVGTIFVKDKSPKTRFLKMQFPEDSLRERSRTGRYMGGAIVIYS